MSEATGSGPHLELLHEHVARQLRQQVLQLPEGTRIPTEPELMVQFDVSRTTVRRAVDAMVSEGLLRRQPPKGTFVTRPPFRQALDHPGAFLDTLLAGKSELTPSLTALRWLTTEDGGQLPSGIGPEALYFERFYTHHERPCAVADVYVAAPFARDISRADLERSPSYKVFTTKLGIPIDHTDATINVTEADTDRAGRLGLTTGASLIMLHRRMYTSDGQLVQYSRHYLPAHQFELSLSHTGATGVSAAQPSAPAVLRLLSPVAGQPEPTTEREHTA